MAEETTDTPPRRRRRTEADPKPLTDDSSAPPVSAPGKPVKVLQSRLEKFFVGMALPFAAAGDLHCAGVLVQRGPIVAEAWANLAAESPAVKRMLESLLVGGAWAGAISSTIALVVPIASHHGAPIPDFASAIIMGPTPTQEPESEGGEPSTNGHTPPTRAPTPSSEPIDPRNPANYPGN